MLACPEKSAWEQFLLGQVDDPASQELSRHLAECPACCETAERLELDDPLVAALHDRREPTPRREIQESTRLMERLRLLATLPILDDEDSTIAPATAMSIIEEYRQLFSPSQADDEIGRIEDRFRILQILGQGGWGVVFLADDLKNERKVALKVVRPALAHSAKVNERFLNEVRALANFDHDHIVEIYDADDFSGVPYLVMPCLQGETLKQRLQRRDHPLPLTESLRIAREIATALAEAHLHGLLHRDIKPENIFLESVVEQAARLLPSAQLLEEVKPQRQAGRLSPQKDGKFTRVKLLDFGIARAFGAARDAQPQQSLTQTGAILGTLEYMAPEQARGDDVDRHCDLFSLGCVFYEMLTGASPFRGKTPACTLLAVQADPPAALKELHAKVPAAVSAFALKLLAKDPQKRPESAKAVIAAITDLEFQLKQGRLKSARQVRRQQVAALVAASVLVIVTVYFSVVGFRRNPPNVAGSLREPNADVRATSQAQQPAFGESGPHSSPAATQIESQTDATPGYVTNAYERDELPKSPLVLRLDKPRRTTFDGDLKVQRDGDESLQRDKHWFRVQTVRAGWLVIEAHVLENAVNTELRLYDADFQLVEEDGYSGPGKDAQIIRPVGQNETFHIAVFEKEKGSGPYLLVVTQPDEPPPMPPELGVDSNLKDAYGNEASAAHELKFHDTGHAFVVGSIRPEGDKDWFQITAPQTGRLLIKSETPNSSLDTFFQLFRAETDAQVAEDRERIVFQVIAGERYRLLMKANDPLKDKKFDPDGNYILRLRLLEE